MRLRSFFNIYIYLFNRDINIFHALLLMWPPREPLHSTLLFFFNFFILQYLGKLLDPLFTSDVCMYSGRHLYQYNKDDFLLIISWSLTSIFTNCKFTCKQRKCVRQLFLLHVYLSLSFISLEEINIKIEIVLHCIDKYVNDCTSSKGCSN